MVADQTTPPAETFGQMCVRVISEKRELIGKVPPEEAAKIIDQLFTEAKRRPKKPEGEKTPRPRNPLVDGIMTACFEDPLLATDSALRTAAVAVAAIKRVCPDVTPEELARAAKKYKQKNPLWTLSPAALSNHWHEVHSRATPVRVNDPYVAPANWQALARRVWGNGIELPENWLDISILNRTDLLKHA
jgi:hypothetical protein